jgi:hypothetical protein
MALFRHRKDIDDGLSGEDRERVANYTSCFAGPAGDAVIADLYLLTGFPTSIFDSDDVGYDPIRAAHRDGMKTVLLRILNYSGKMEQVFK